MDTWKVDKMEKLIELFLSFTTGEKIAVATVIQHNLVGFNDLLEKVQKAPINDQTSELVKRVLDLSNAISLYSLGLEYLEHAETSRAMHTDKVAESSALYTIKEFMEFAEDK